jgi:membrane-bound ClpP family serine protease
MKAVLGISLAILLNLAYFGLVYLGFLNLPHEGINPIFAIFIIVGMIVCWYGILRLTNKLLESFNITQ